MLSALSFPKAIRSLLGRVGLEEKEISVYLTLLSLKTSKITELATLAQQSRSYTYLIIRSLIRKGLVSEIERGKVIHVVAEPVSRLIELVHHKEEEMQEVGMLLTQVLPVLQSLSLPLIGKPRVTLSCGVEGMRAIYRDALPHHFSSLFNPKAMYQAFGENLAVALAKKHMRLRGRDLLIDNPATYRYLREVDPDPEYDYRILPKKVSFYSDTLIFHDTVVLFPYDSEMTIVRIEHQNLANTFLSWFNLMWDSSKPVDRNAPSSRNTRS